MWNNALRQPLLGQFLFYDTVLTRAVKLAVKGQPADLVRLVEMDQPADFSSRLSGLKVVIKLNNNIISSFLIKPV